LIKAIKLSRIKRRPISVFDVAQEEQTSLDNWT